MPKHPANLDELYGLLVQGRVKFAPKPVYIAEADCVIYHHKNVAMKGAWLDRFVTLFRDRQTGQIVGFKVKCVREVVDSLLSRKRGRKPRRVRFADVIDEAARLSAEDRDNENLQRTREESRKSDVAAVEIPRDAYAKAA